MTRTRALVLVVLVSLVGFRLWAQAGPTTVHAAPFVDLSIDSPVLLVGATTFVRYSVTDDSTIATLSWSSAAAAFAGGGAFPAGPGGTACPPSPGAVQPSIEYSAACLAGIDSPDATQQVVSTTASFQ